MSKVFMAKYVESLKGKIPDLEKNLVNELFKKKWVVYAKRPFGNPESVIEYLGRYTDKIAISNHRLLSVENGKVTFSYKDYRKEAQKQEMTLDAIELKHMLAQTATGCLPSAGSLCTYCQNGLS